ncbi:MAG: methyltransferase [Micromonosporaceae bacterium]
MSDNPWTVDADLSAAFARHLATLRGAVRQALVSRALLQHLHGGPMTVLDVGGGAGHLAIALARLGHEVVLLDPDQAALDRAAAALDAEDDAVRSRMRLVRGSGEDDAAGLRPGGFDVVCCHGVLMYAPDPAALLGALVAATSPGGLVSVLAKNGEGLAMRPGIEGRWSDALAMFDRREEVGNLGVPSRGDSVRSVREGLAAAGAETIAWYGVRVFTDHLRDQPVGPDFDHVVAAEWEAGRRDPYRQVARLLHVLARRAAR